MGLGNAAIISESLMGGGMAADFPAAIISKGSTPEQKVAVTTVSDLAGTVEREGLEAPGIIIVGTVVQLRRTLGDLI